MATPKTLKAAQEALTSIAMEKGAGSMLTHDEIAEAHGGQGVESASVANRSIPSIRGNLLKVGLALRKVEGEGYLIRNAPGALRGEVTMGRKLFRAAVLDREFGEIVTYELCHDIFGAGTRNVRVDSQVRQEILYLRIHHGIHLKKVKYKGFRLDRAALKRTQTRREFCEKAWGGRYESYKGCTRYMEGVSPRDFRDRALDMGFEFFTGNRKVDQPFVIAGPCANCMTVFSEEEIDDQGQCETCRNEYRNPLDRERRLRRERFEEEPGRRARFKRPYLRTQSGAPMRVSRT